MRKFVILSMVVVLSAGEPKVLEEFVVNYFLLSKSKMEYSPTAWQDTRDGYFRAYGAYKADQVMDSLDSRAISYYQAGIRHFKAMDEIREEVVSGKKFEYVVDRKLKPNHNVNYFSSSKE